MIYNKIIKLTPTKESSSALLSPLKENIGFIPNIFSVIGESTHSLKAFIEMNHQFGQSTLSATEREVVQVAVSVENNCNYCVAGHTKFAEVHGVDPDVIHAIREDRPIQNKKLESLKQFAQSMTRNRGFLSSKQIKEFIDAGFKAEQVIEVILGICLKTFSNLTNNLLTVEIDEAFQTHEWKATNNQYQIANI